jgi:hypothetical protein
MNDREFIELLNLYVDREISAEDARRLEAEVANHPGRREVYDQYCRIQKACSMLSEETLEASAAEAATNLISFPGARSWRLGPMVVGLAAAAACAVIILRHHAVSPTDGQLASVGQDRAGAIANPATYTDGTDGMKPVFLVRLPSVPAPRGSQGALFADTGAQAAQFNWIGDIHMAPIFPSTNADFMLGPKADMKAAVLGDAQVGRDAQEPVEMTAFRFQR